jgi:DNA-binding transcriptional MerR regulator
MRGMYLAHEAGRLAGVHGDRIGQWARWGHIRASVSDGDPHVYAFADVADALAVHVLEEAGLPLPVIRAAVEHLGGEHPLAQGLHVVDGRMAVERAGGLEDVFTEQRVLELDGHLDPVALLRAGGWPSLVTGVTAIEVDPERLAGRPCIRGRRIPVDVAAEGGLGLGDDEVEQARTWCAASS